MSLSAVPKRIIAGVSVFFLFFQQFQLCADVRPEQSAPLAAGAPIQISPELGHIRYSSAGRGISIVHIETAHGSYEAQSKIRGILQELKDRYGYRLVLVEGSAFPLRREFLRFSDSSAKNNQILDLLAKRGIAKGAEIFLANNPDAQVRGIEDLELYNENGDALVALSSLAPRLRPLVSKIESERAKTLARLTPAFQNFLRRSALYDSGRMPLASWAAFLKANSKQALGLDFEDPFSQIEYPMFKRFLAIAKSGESWDEPTFQKEKGQLLASVRDSAARNELGAYLRESRADRLSGKSSGKMLKILRLLPQDFDIKHYPQITAFLALNLLEPEINARVLSQEMNILSAKMEIATAKTPEDLDFLQQQKKFRLMKKLLMLKVTASDEPDLGPVRRQPENFIETFSRGMNPEDKKIVLQAVKASLRFYEAARKRDAGMLHNVERELESSGEKKAVVITGGFHSEPFRNYFKAKGYAYHCAVPELKSQSTRAHYFANIVKYYSRLPDVPAAAYEDAYALSVTPEQLAAEHRKPQEWFEGEVMPVLGISREIILHPATTSALSAGIPLLREYFPSLTVASNPEPVSVSSRSELRMDFIRRTEEGLRKILGFTLTPKVDWARYPELADYLRFYGKKPPVSVPMGLDLDLIQAALVNKRVPLDKLPSAVNGFLRALSAGKQSNAAVMGDAVLESFFHIDPEDINIAMKVEVKQDLHEALLAPNTLLPFEYYSIVRKQLEALAKTLGTSVSDLEIPPGDARGVKHDGGLGIHYYGPVQGSTPSHIMKYVKRYLLNAENGDVYFDGSGDPLSRMAIDAVGKIYVRGQALIDLIYGQFEIVGDAQHLSRANLLRAIQLKHRYGLKVKGEGEKILNEAAERFNKKKLSPLNQYLIQKLIRTAADPAKAGKELIAKGILPKGHFLISPPRSELRNAHRSEKFAVLRGWLLASAVGAGQELILNQNDATAQAPPVQSAAASLFSSAEGAAGISYALKKAPLHLKLIAIQSSAARRDQNAVDELIDLLDENGPNEIAAAALQAINEIGAPKGLFFAALYNGDLERAAGLSSKGLFKEDALRHPSSRIRSAAKQLWLRDMNKENIRRLFHLATGENITARNSALSILAQTKDPLVFDFLVTALTHQEYVLKYKGHDGFEKQEKIPYPTNWMFRQDIKQAIAESGAAIAERLTRLLERSEPWIRLEVLEILRGMPDRPILPAVMKLRSDSDPRIAAFAKSISDPETRELKEAFDSSDVDRIRKYGAEGVNYLREILIYPYSGGREKAAQLLYELKTKEAFAVLLDELKNPHSPANRAVIDLADLTRDSVFLDDLVALFQYGSMRRDVPVENNARILRLVGAYRTSASLDHLLSLLKERKNFPVGYYQILGKILSGSADSIFEELDEITHSGEYTYDQRTAALQAMAGSRRRDAASRIIDLLGEDNELGETAAKSLEGLSTPESLFYADLYHHGRKFNESDSSLASAEKIFPHFAQWSGRLIPYARAAIRHNNSNIRSAAANLLHSNRTFFFQDRALYFWTAMPVFFRGLSALGIFAAAFFSSNWFFVSASFKLGKYKVRLAQRPLRAIARSKNQERRNHALRLLSGYGPGLSGKSVNFLQGIFPALSGDSNAADFILLALGRTKRKEVLPFIFDNLNEKKSSLIRIAAANALDAYFETPEEEEEKIYLPKLIDLLSDFSLRVHEVILSLLRRFNSPEAGFYAALASGKSNEAAKYDHAIDYAVQALGHPRSKIQTEGQTVLRHSANDPRANFYLALVSGNLTEAMKVKDKFRFAQEAAAHKNLSVRLGAARVLQESAERVPPAIMDLLLSDRESEIRRIGAAVSAQTDSEVSAGRLIDLMRSDLDPGVRAAAASSLGARREISAEDELIQALADPNETVKKAVSDALFLLPSDKAKFYGQLYIKSPSEAALVPNAHQWVEEAASHSSPDIAEQAVITATYVLIPEAGRLLSDYLINRSPRPEWNALITRSFERLLPNGPSPVDETVVRGNVAAMIAGLRTLLPRLTEFKSVETRVMFDGFGEEESDALYTEDVGRDERKKAERRAEPFFIFLQRAGRYAKPVSDDLMRFVRNYGDSTASVNHAIATLAAIGGLDEERFLEDVFWDIKSEEVSPSAMQGLSKFKTDSARFHVLLFGNKIDEAARIPSALIYAQDMLASLIAAMRKNKELSPLHKKLALNLIEVLGLLASREARKILHAFFNYKDFPEGRAAAAKALRTQSDDKTIDLLIGALEEPDPRIRASAAFSLGEIARTRPEARPAKAVTPLFKALLRSTSQAPQDVWQSNDRKEARKAAEEALLNYGYGEDSELLEDFFELAENETSIFAAERAVLAVRQAASRRSKESAAAWAAPMYELLLDPQNGRAGKFIMELWPLLPENFRKETNLREEVRKKAPAYVTGFGEAIQTAKTPGALLSRVTLGGKIGHKRRSAADQTLFDPTADTNVLAQQIKRILQAKYKEQKKKETMAEIQITLGYDTGEHLPQEERGKFNAYYLFVSTAFLPPEEIHYAELSEGKPERERDLNAAKGLLIRGKEVKEKYAGQMQNRRLDYFLTVSYEVELSELALALKQIQLLNLGLLLATAEEQYKLYLPEDLPKIMDPQRAAIAEAYRRFERSVVRLLRKYDIYREPDQILPFPNSSNDQIRRDMIAKYPLEYALFPDAPWLNPLMLSDDKIWDKLRPRLRGTEAMMFHKAPAEGEMRRGIKFIHEMRALGKEATDIIQGLLTAKKMDLPETRLNVSDPFLDDPNEKNVQHYPEAQRFYVRQTAEAIKNGTLPLTRLPDLAAFRAAAFDYGVDLNRSELRYVSRSNNGLAAKKEEGPDREEPAQLPRFIPPAEPSEPEPEYVPEHEPDQSPYDPAEPDYQPFDPDEVPNPEEPVPAGRGQFESAFSRFKREFAVRGEILPLALAERLDSEKETQLLARLLGRGTAASAARIFDRNHIPDLTPADAFKAFSSIPGDKGYVLLDESWVRALIDRNPRTLYLFLSVMDRLGKNSDKHALNILSQTDLRPQLQQALLRKTSGLSWQEKIEVKKMMAGGALTRLIGIVDPAHLPEYLKSADYAAALLNSDVPGGPQDISTFYLAPGELSDRDLQILVFLIPALLKAAELIRHIPDATVRRKIILQHLREILPGSRGVEGGFRIAAEEFFRLAVLETRAVQSSA